MPELPRITRALRTFTALGRIKSTADLEPNDLFKKQQEQLKSRHSRFTWQDFYKHVPMEVQAKLNMLREITEKVFGECSSELINEFLMFVLRLLIDDRHLSNEKFAMLSEKAKNLKFSDANKILKIIKEIRETLNSDMLMLIANEDKHIDNDGIFKSELFDPKFEYTPAKVLWPNTDMLSSMLPKDSTSDKGDFLIKIVGEATQQLETKFDKETYKKCLMACYSKYKLLCTLEEFETSIISKLENHTHTQNELLDFLGFENIENMQYFIQNRKYIIALRSAPKVQKSYNDKGPMIASQVIVQSKKEKQLYKQVQKQEKKLGKIANKQGGKGETSEHDNERLELYLKKQEALVEMRKPLLRNDFVHTRSAEPRYPFVFDSNRNSKNKISYVSKQNVMLPETVVREDTDNFEKVLIPITTSESCNVDYKPVLVSSLDEIGQQAFEGIESLNRIQSIVFDAAYGTNENLLICAPTGAGKTNIGMLTVVHQLRQYIEHGEIMKDKFKIIYVAPMKALAAEITANFSRRLQRLGISVCELTGDMQLTKREIQQTQMIVTTPEKWDVVTRKGIGDTSLTGIVKLLIIDEVHLLHSDRGPVVEALVARTLRQVESSQSMIRIVGLSATLPNYLDVARFLRVNPYVGLFYFDYRFRPVPLSQTFIGVKVTSPLEEMNAMDEVCYDNVINMLRGGHQAMVFVHARNATVRVANALKNLAQQDGTLKYFVSEGRSKFSGKPFAKSRNNILSELFDSGISVHHAGLSRMDRNLVEKYFSDGLVKVLVCTSTLAWGVNLPAHAVIIRGTEIYDAKYGSYIDLDILDVLQIFGRAGRPQFDTSGHAVIITSHGKLYHYLKLLTNQIPIESNFIKYLADNLNAEIALGTISNVKEAIEWLSYTYLFVRMKLNPLVYGMNHQDVSGDPNLEMKRQKLIDTAASALDKAKMIRYNEQTGDFSTTDLGRIASHFYLKYDTIEIFNQLIKPIMTEANIFAMVSHSQEFEQIKVRDDEMNELDNLFECCEITVQGGVENIYGKVNILLQTYLSRGFLNSFSLMSDQAYIVSNVVRICRALFKIMLGQNNAIMSARLLEISKMFEAQQWSYKHPLHQFSCLSVEVIDKLDRYNLTIDRLKDMDIKEIGDILRNQKIAALVKKCCEELPVIEMESNSQPITRTVLRIRLKIYPQFRWNDNVHGKTSSEPFWIWIEDPESNFIYHYEYYCVTRKMVYGQQEDELVMTIPLREPLPSQYIVKATSDRWLGCESTLSLTFHDLILPEDYPPHTDLLKLQPLPVKALQETAYENLYQFSHFNPIQTQLFHCLYHTDNNVLLGAPTGSGKTIVAEIAMFRIFKQYPSQKIVYIAPLKALVRERMKDWKVRLEQKLGKKVIELTGDVSPDVRAIASTNVIVTTPEKWDGISRSWQTRDYVKNTGLVIIDEIHLLGEDRGPVLEVIISRTNFISSHTSRKLRIVGLSTALANAVDLAHWLGIRDMGLYNFRPSVRPVPLEIHVNGFPGKHYCPRMATMNKPTFQAIRQHAPNSPSLVFVSSRRQTRLTALDLISYLAAEDDSKQWLHMPNEEMNSILEQIRDTNLKLTLAFGIGLHHAGLQDKDKQIVEELFFHNKIQVLVTTATLAWGVNFPAHLVVIKGTEYYDGKTKKYVDMPITDVLQMMGRAGRPQFDDSAVAVVLVHDVKKDFYKKFLHEPFPVESSLLAVLPDHINAEIVAGTIRNKQEFLDYLTWTYFFRRLMKNPKYYNLCDLEPVVINGYLSSLVDDTLKVLLESRCIDFNEEEQILYSLPMGNIASYYYLSYRTISMFGESLRDNLTLEQYLHILCDSYEYDELPVRHNEDILNEELSKMCRYRADNYSYNSPHTKTFLLLQAHFSRLPMPCADYVTDLKSVLDQAVRIVQAMINIVAEQGWLYSTLMITNLLQMIIQARWIDECAITTLPYIDSQYLQLFNTLCLPALCASLYNKYELLMETLGKEFQEEQIRQIYMVIRRMPMINVDLSVELCGEITNRQKISLRPNNLMCISIHKDQEYILNIGLKRIHKCDSLKVHSPQFQKGKDEGWFLVFGDIPNRTLFAFKRVSSLKEQWKQHHLQFTAPSELGETTLTFFLMSDCYLGLDQQYDIQVNVIP